MGTVNSVRRAYKNEVKHYLDLVVYGSLDAHFVGKVEVATATRATRLWDETR